MTSFNNSLKTYLMNKRYLATLAMVFALTGCTTIHENDYVQGPDYEPENVYVAPLAVSVQRVALLPVTVARDDRDHQNGVTALEPLLQRSLVSRQAFEVAPVSTAWLQRQTGQARWRLDEPLPADLIAQIQQAYGCDSVLFAELAEYHPYPPMRIGWHLKLVAGPEATIAWSANEIFDASRQDVVNSARRFYQAHQWGVRGNGHSRAILDSPRRFGAYSVSEVLRTLGAQKIAKVETPNADR